MFTANLLLHDADNIGAQTTLKYIKHAVVRYDREKSKGHLYMSSSPGILPLNYSEYISSSFFFNESRGKTRREKFEIIGDNIL